MFEEVRVSKVRVSKFEESPKIKEVIYGYYFMVIMMMPLEFSWWNAIGRFFGKFFKRTSSLKNLLG